jgi:two-component system sensor histidine kinase UhpB
MATRAPMQSHPAPVHSRLTALVRHPAFAGVLTFALVLVIVLGTWWHVEAQIRQAARNRFVLHTAQITSDLQHDFAACEDVLRGAGAFVATTPALTPDAWRQYVARLDLDDTLPYVRALGYAPLATAAVPAASATSAMPAASPSAPATPAASAPAGSPASSLASGPADAGAAPAAAVTLMTPHYDGAPPDGVDLAREPDRRAALQRVLASGKSALVAIAAPRGVGVVTLAPHLELYLPVYDGDGSASAAGRRVTGVLIAIIDARALFAHGLAHPWGIALQAFAGPAATPLYDSEPLGDLGADSASAIRHTASLRVAGLPLTLVYTADARYLAAGTDYTGPAVLLGGLLCTLVFAALAWLAARQRSGIVSETRRARTQSSLDEARMMGIIRSSMEAIITIDEQQRVVIFNPMAEQLFGVPAMEAIGAPLARFIPERFRDAHARHVDQFGVTGVSDRQMGKQRVLFGLRANGEEFPIEASISQVRDASGKLYTVMLRDVTQRVRADEAQRKAREELRELSANLQSVREEEKTRIARELHDDLGQQLTALKMDLSALEERLAEPGTARDGLFAHLREMRRLIDATVASVRRIAADLRPVMLDDLGLVPAIEWLANDFTNRYGIDVARQIDVAGTRFSRRSATTVFRIVQEALTNVARHADATRVTLEIRVSGDTCVLRIADNGKGVDPHARPGEKSFGLLGMRERAHMFGGSVDIRTGNGVGFAVVVTFPLHAIEEQESPT